MTEKPFLERWSRRKAAVGKAAPEAEAAAAPPATADAGTAAQPPDAAAEPISEEELAALPPVETLDAGSDIRAFLRPGVPSALKNAALRRMWHVTPAIRDHKDIAVDYAWDWNTPGGVPGDGGRLLPEKVAQWARQIAGREEPAPRARPPATDAPAAKPGSDAPPSAPAAHAPPPQADDEQDARDRGAELPPDASAPAVRKRHGGARPD